MLPEVTALTLSEARAEAAQLRLELVRSEQEIAVARAAGLDEVRAAAGLRKATISTRLGLVNRRVRELDGDNELYRLRTAVRELAGDDLADRIFQRAKDMRKELSVEEAPAASETAARERLTTKRLKR